MTPLFQYSNPVHAPFLERAAAAIFALTSGLLTGFLSPN